MMSRSQIPQRGPLNLPDIPKSDSISNPPQGLPVVLPDDLALEELENDWNDTDITDELNKYL